jgi:hypothetical protein
MSDVTSNLGAGFSDIADDISMLSHEPFTNTTAATGPKLSSSEKSSASRILPGSTTRLMQDEMDSENFGESLSNLEMNSGTNSDSSNIYADE